MMAEVYPYCEICHCSIDPERDGVLCGGCRSGMVSSPWEEVFTVGRQVEELSRQVRVLQAQVKGGVAPRDSGNYLPVRELRKLVPDTKTAWKPGDGLAANPAYRDEA